MRNAWLVSIATACGSSPSPPTKPPEIRVNVETFAELAVGPGNIAVTPDRRVFVSLHQFYEPADPVVELKNTAVVPVPDPAKAKELALDSVLGIRADSRGIIWMLDNGMRRGGTRKIVGWN